MVQHNGSYWRSQHPTLRSVYLFLFLICCFMKLHHTSRHVQHSRIHQTYSRIIWHACLVFNLYVCHCSTLLYSTMQRAPMQTTTWSKCTWKISDSLGVMASETSAGQVSFAEVSWSMQQLFAERLNNRLKLLFRSFQRKPRSGLGFGASQLVVLDTPSVHMLHWKDLGCPTAVPTQEADSQRLVAIDPSSLDWLHASCIAHCQATLF